MDPRFTPDPTEPDRPIDGASVEAVAALLTPDARAAFLRRACPEPSLEQSRTFAADLGLAFGALFAGAAVIFFFAANWQGMDRFSKLGSLAGAFAVCAVAAWWSGFNRPVGAALQTVATLIFGSLLAVYGQIYQTGADAWELFFWWALLLTPWTLLSRRPLPWLFSLGLFDLSLLLYFEQVHHWWEPAGFALISAAMTGTAWTAWELMARGKAPWLGRELGPRLLSCATFAALIGPAVQYIVLKRNNGNAVVLALLVALIAFTLTVYRQRVSRSIFAPAVALGALLTLSTAVLIRVVEAYFEFELFFLLTLGFLLVAKISAAVWWLRRMASEPSPVPETSSEGDAR